MVKQLDFLPEYSGSIPTSPLQFSIKPIDKAMAANVYAMYHYLADKGFLHSYSYGCFYDSHVLGAITFGIPNAKNINGLYDSESQDGVYEITRLAIHDDCPKNSESRLIGIAIKQLRKTTYVKAIISYADTAQGHEGTIYKATNFEYWGLTAQKTDFVEPDGKIRKRKGVKYSTLDGEWIKRSRKHLYVKRYLQNKTHQEGLANPQRRDPDQLRPHLQDKERG